MEEIMVPMSEIIEMISMDVIIEVPDREYVNMTHLQCYESGLIDAGTFVRKSIRDAIEAKYGQKQE